MCTTDLFDTAAWHGHLGWCFRGTAQFEGLAGPFLAEGSARHERLVLVSDDPRPDQWPRWLLGTGQLTIASTDEVYGPGRVVDASSQRKAFEAMVDEALADGYAGLRVIADNTSLIEGPERLEAWLAWEVAADRFMAERPVTGLCTFDEARARPEDLAAARAVHDRLLATRAASA
jgi:hypothetical protein